MRRKLPEVTLPRGTKRLRPRITRGNVTPMVKSASAIIEEKGGPTAFAKAVGKNPGAVRLWKHRNYFPRSAWPEINSAFPDLALDVLRAVEAGVQ